MASGPSRRFSLSRLRDGSVPYGPIGPAHRAASDLISCSLVASSNAHLISCSLVASSRARVLPARASASSTELRSW